MILQLQKLAELTNCAREINVLSDIGSSSLTAVFLQEFTGEFEGERASQVALVVKNPPANAGDIRDMGSIPGLGRSPGGRYGNPLQYSCLENPMDKGAWWAIAHGVAKSQTRLSDLAWMHALKEKTHCRSYGRSWNIARQKAQDDNLCICPRENLLKIRKIRDSGKRRTWWS